MLLYEAWSVFEIQAWQSVDIGIDAVLSELRAAAARAKGTLSEAGVEAAGTSTDFGAVLKASLDQVNQGQQSAQKLTQDYELGTGAADLNDVMIALQKANISFQAAIQVRNRLVSAYHDIMNMQV
jgi:flagellar hook-basal body complex protein FliE